MGRRWWQKEARANAEKERLASKKAAALLETASEAIKDGHITASEVIAVASAVEEIVEAVYNDFVSDKSEETTDQNDSTPEFNDADVKEESEVVAPEKIENVIEAAAPVVTAIVNKVANNNQNHKNSINKNKRRR